MLVSLEVSLQTKGGARVLNSLSSAVFPDPRRTDYQDVATLQIKCPELFKFRISAGKRKYHIDDPERVPRRSAKYVTAHDKGEPPKVARPYYELALLTTLNERLKSGDVTVTHSRRWTDFEDYLIPRVTWAKEREQHHAKLGLPLQGEQYLVQLQAQLAAVTAEVDRRVPGNSALSIDAQKGEFHLAALKGADKPDEAQNACSTNSRSRAG